MQWSPAERSRIGWAGVALTTVTLMAGCTTQSVPRTAPDVTQTGPTAAGTQVTRSLRAPDGTVRTYRLYLPASAVDGVAAVPLLVALHGGGGSADHFEATSGFDAVADRFGFVVAYPDAARPDGARVSTWNAGGCCGAGARARIDDVGLLRQVIAAVSTDRPVDPNRVYLAGHSNGGMLAYRAACELADTVAAIGVQSATLEYEPCLPARPVSLIHLHGDADTHVPIDGGRGTQGVTRVDFTPPRQAAATVATGARCSPTTTDHPAGPGTTVRTWDGCPDGIEVAFVTVAGGPHQWMPDSADRIWAFLSAHPRPPG